jgi:hypothetical protein
MKKIIVSTFCSLMVVMAFGQQPMNTNKPRSNKPEDVYNWRILQEELDGVYIPADIAECFIELDKKISVDSKAKFMAADELTVMRQLHYSLGRWIWYNWGFYEGSRLSVYMNKVGVKQPEDMADFIIVAYHRYLNKKPIEPAQLVAFFIERKKREEAEREKARQGKN